MSELSKEEITAICDKCLSDLLREGAVYEKSFVFIRSSSLGIRKLGKADFLAAHGYKIVFQEDLNVRKPRKMQKHKKMYFV